MVDLCECDVKNKDKLALFRIKRSEWKKLLVGSFPHSIFHQISNMLWDDAIFRTFFEARRLTPENGSSETAFNIPLIELLDKGFVTAQVMAIRRLTDSTFHDPKKTVISLPSIIDDIEANTTLITRENYICYDGAAYSEPSEANDHLSWLWWKNSQENFDLISGTPETERKRSDKISKSFLQNAKNDLKICQKFRTYANKFIAHASDPKNHTWLSKEDKTITLQRLDENYQAIIRIGLSIALIVNEVLLCEIATPQFNVFKDLDKPMASRSLIEKLVKFWHQRVAEVEQWSRVFQ